jgi:hypothetical protein
MSDIEGKAARVAAMECGQRQSFKPRIKFGIFLFSLAITCRFSESIPKIFAPF